MALGYVTDDEFESELNKSTPISSRVDIIEKRHRGRQEGDKNVPDSLQKIIGETSEIDGRQEALAIAKALGISASSVSAYANGSTSTSSYDKPKPELKFHITKAKQRIAKSASRKLKLALDNLTETKLQVATAREISGVAKDMSAVMKDMTVDSSSGENNDKKPFVIFAPQFIQENNFETIVVEE